MTLLQKLALGFAGVALAGEFHVESMGGRDRD